MARVRPDAECNPRVLWFYGSDAVGKSTIGWEAYSILVDQDAHVAYVDTDYLSFCHPGPENPAEVVADTLRGVWTVYRARGARHLVVSGVIVSTADRDILTAAIPDAHVTFCRLTATAATVRRRIVGRREAEAASQDSILSPATRAVLAEYGDRSVAFGDLLQQHAWEDFALTTDETTPYETAAEAIRRYLAVKVTAPPST